MKQREIKFRIWTGIKFDFTTIEKLIYEGGQYYDYDEKNREYPVMQFTGRKDKNGKDIYEGDIISTRMRGYPETLWQVIWGKNESGGMDVYNS